MERIASFPLDAAPLAPENVKFSLDISQFPESLHETLRAIDDEGDGKLELDEITEVFEMYVDIKKSQKDGSIAISTLPKEIQPSLKEFDVDGDGTVAPNELAMAAKMYKESKNQVKQLRRALAVVFLVLVLTIAAVVGLTAVVVEESKETKTRSDGITLVKGTNTPAAAATVTEVASLSDANKLTAAQLNEIKSLTFTDEKNSAQFAYTITGWSKKDIGSAKATTTLYAARGDLIVVRDSGEVTVRDSSGTVVYTQGAPKKRRSLLAAGGGATMYLGMSVTVEPFSIPTNAFDVTTFTEGNTTVTSFITYDNFTNATF